MGWTSIPEFKKAYGDTPLTIIVDDRGAQITFEFINSYELSPTQRTKLEAQGIRLGGATDLLSRSCVERPKLLGAAGIAVTARLAGVFALDFAVLGVSRALVVRYVIDHLDEMEGFELEAGFASDSRAWKFGATSSRRCQEGPTVISARRCLERYGQSPSGMRCRRSSHPAKHRALGRS